MSENKITGLAIWNMILSILVFMLMVTLWSTQEDLKTERELTQMGHDSQHKSLMEVAEAVGRNSESITRNAESILKINGATTANSESAWALFEYAQTLSDKIASGIAGIYQGHIIPLRSFHMENFDE